MAKLTRRQWLKVGLAFGGLSAFGLSYREVAKRAIDGLIHGTSGRVTLIASTATRCSPKGGQCRNGKAIRSRPSR